VTLPPQFIVKKFKIRSTTLTKYFCLTSFT